MILYILVSLLSAVAGAVLYSKFGAVAYADLQKAEQSIRDEIASLRAHVTATAGVAKATLTKVEADARQIATDAKL